MTTWPAVADLGDLPRITAGFRPFTDALPTPAPRPRPRPREDHRAAARRIRADLNLAVRRSRRARGADTRRAA